MYNEYIKRRYIEKKERTVVLPNNYLILQFNKVEELEKALDKDVSNFTVYEILEHYKVLNLSSLESLFVLNSQFSMYTQWCLQENLVRDNQNHYLEITKDILGGCINKAVLDRKIVTRETVLKWIEEIPNPKDQFVMLSLFEYGKSKNFADIVNASIYDIRGNILELNDGREVIISDKLKDIAKESYTEDTYYSISGKGVKKMPLVLYENRIVRNYPNTNVGLSEFQSGRIIYGSITRSLNYVGVLDWCSANSLAESGKIHMIKEKAQELKITPMQYLYSDKIKDVEKQYGCNVVRSIFSVKYKEHLS